MFGRLVSVELSRQPSGPPPVVVFIPLVGRGRQAVQDFSDLQGPVIHGAAFSCLRISEITCSSRCFNLKVTLVYFVIILTWINHGSPMCLLPPDEDPPPPHSPLHPYVKLWFTPFILVFVKTTWFVITRFDITIWSPFFFCFLRNFIFLRGFGSSLWKIGSNRYNCNILQVLKRKWRIRDAKFISIYRGLYFMAHIGYDL